MYFTEIEFIICIWLKVCGFLIRQITRLPMILSYLTYYYGMLTQDVGATRVTYIYSVTCCVKV